jgi:hypothetical protein
MKRLLALVAVMALAGGCASSAKIAQIQHNPARYYDKTVSISGVVTSSWGLPLVALRVYKVSDGTGEVTVLSQSNRAPAKGSHVRVKGKVSDVGMFGGQSLGLHIREESLHIE